MEDEHENDGDVDIDDKDGNGSPSEVGDGGNADIKKGEEGGIDQDGPVEQGEENVTHTSKESDNDISEESEDDAPRQILRHDSQPNSGGDSPGEGEPFVDHSSEVAVENSATISSERPVLVEDDKQQRIRQTSKTRTETSRSPDKSLLNDDGLSLDATTFDDLEVHTDDDDLSDGTLDPVPEILISDDAEKEKEKEKTENVAPSVDVACASDTITTDEDANPVIDREHVNKQQQQNILRKVEAARKERRRGSGGISGEASSKALIVVSCG